MPGYSTNRDMMPDLPPPGSTEGCIPPPTGPAPPAPACGPSRLAA